MTAPRFPLAGSDAARARVAQFAPRKPWDRLLRDDFKPKPGEHVAIIGPTGQGKTTLQNAILPLYRFVAVFATKPQDDTMDQLISDGGYVKLAKWHKLNPIDHPRRVVWPQAGSIRDMRNQYYVFSDAFEKIFGEVGRPKHAPVGWALAIDELWYIVNMLTPPTKDDIALAKHVKLFLFQARSLGHSMVIATQRPANVPVEVYDQSTHLFFFRDNDDANLDRLSAINSRDSRLVRYVIENLEPFQVLYINTRTGAMARTRAPFPRPLHIQRNPTETRVIGPMGGGVEIGSANRA